MGLGDKLANLLVPKTTPPEGYGKPKEPESLLPKGVFNDAAQPSNIGKFTYQGLKKDKDGEVVANFHEKTGEGTYRNWNLDQRGLTESVAHLPVRSPDIDRFNQGQFAMGLQDLRNPQKVFAASMGDIAKLAEPGTASPASKSQPDPIGDLIEKYAMDKSPTTSSAAKRQLEHDAATVGNTRSIARDASAAAKDFESAGSGAAPKEDIMATAREAERVANAVKLAMKLTP